MSNQKEMTRTYFNNVASKWHERAYDPDSNYATFPSGKIRQQVVMLELDKYNLGKKVIDLGCGTGQLVIDFLENGFDAIGIDNSEKMISEARSNLKKYIPEVNPEKIFQVKDVSRLKTKNNYDIVTSMGLVEYLDDDLAFFRLIKQLLKNNGMAFIECRNRMFNLFSCNQYTLSETETGSLKQLVGQIDIIEKYSPVKLSQIDNSYNIFQNINNKMVDVQSLNHQKKLLAKKSMIKEYPSDLLRRQYTPENLDVAVQSVGLKVKYVIYYHIHPFLPRYEKFFPEIFNSTSIKMQPLGYTALGSTVGSAFVALIEKK